MDSCNIKVAIKARPLNHKEQLDGRTYWKIESNSLIHVDPITEKKNGEQFFFDRVFSGNSTNFDVFDEIVRPIIDRGVQGFNGTVFAYGQTASGKTYTMSGDDLNPGIIPLAINYMFDVMNNSAGKEYLLRACYVEIYNEKVIDLLEKKDVNRQSRKIEIQKDGLHITPLKAVVCQNAQMVLDFMKVGEKNRSFGETNMNDRSSRSHTIFRIILESRNIDDDCDGAYQQSIINLVDLAGSERSGQSQSSMERFKEGCKINSSLTTLGLVIQQLSECPDSSQHINFRDSKLTRILQTSLGGNSLTAIICTVTLAVDEQTHNTLSFASRAKKIKNTAKINENVPDETLLKRYRIELSKLNEELEGIKQTQCEHDEVNEIKYKYQEEKRTNEELKARIKRLQNNMITSSVGQKDLSSNKKGYNRRRTWGGKLESTFYANNSMLETIEEDVNIPRPSVPSNFCNPNNKEFKMPLEPFEWNSVREESSYTTDNVLLYKENKNALSPPSSMVEIVCETPKKVLRERVNNYKSMFESSVKENNELREFTTLERQMFYENNEQLKDLDNLRKKVEELQGEKNASARMIEELKRSFCTVENEKRDTEVMMEMQKTKFETRENELLATIQEIKGELESNRERLEKVISGNNLMAEKQNEMNRLEMEINKMNQLNKSYFNEIEHLKLQLSYKDQKLNEELAKHCSVLNEMSHFQNHLAEIRSIPFATQFLADEGYFTFKKCEIEELYDLLGSIYDTIDQLQQENRILKDENNNFVSIKNNLTDTINNVNRENNELKSKLNDIEVNIRSVIKDFSASSEVDVVDSQINSLIRFAADYFEQNTIKINELSNENIHLKEELSTNKIENNELKSKLNDIEVNIRCIIKDFSASSEIDVDSCQIDGLIDFAADYFEQNTIKIDALSNENIHLKEKLSLTSKTENDEFKSKLNHIEVYIKSVIKDFSASSEIDVDSCQIESLIDFAADYFEQNTNKIDELSNENIHLKEKLSTNKIENDQLKSKLNHIEVNIKSIIKDFSASSEINVDSCQIGSLIEFAADYFEQNTNKIHELTNKNINLKEELSLLNCKLCKVKSFMLNTLDTIHESFSTMEAESSMEMDNLKKELTKTMEENEFLKSSIETLEKCYQSCVENVKHKEMIESQLQVDLLTKTNDLQKTVDKLSEMQMKIESNECEMKKLNSLLNSAQTELKEKLITEMDNNKIENVNIDQLNELNTMNSDLKKKLDEKCISENKIVEDLLTKTKELENAFVRLSDCQSSYEEMKIKADSSDNIIVKLNTELDVVKCELVVKTKLVEEFESKSEANKYLEEIDKLNDVINNLQCELKDKLKTEEILKNELLLVTEELDNALCAVNKVKLTMDNLNNQRVSNICVVEQLNNDIEILKSTLEDKTRLIFELENTNLDLLTKFKNFKDADQFKKIIVELEVKLEDKIKIEKDLQNELLAKIVQLEDSRVKENEVQSLVESMEMEIKSNIDLMEHLKSELASKSNLLIEMENKNSELLFKSSELENFKLKEYEMFHKDLMEQLETVVEERNLIQTELNLTNHKFSEISKLYNETKIDLDDKLQLHVMNYKNLYGEFVNLSCDIDLLIQLKIKTEFDLKEEILRKSIEIDDLQKQVQESSLDEYYSKLEEEFVSKSRECDEAHKKIVNLETLLSTKEKIEVELRNNLEAKCNALVEYKKNVEFLFSKNDSFQLRVNDFEDNVLVDLNEEFDSLKQELSKKTEHEKVLLEEKAELESNLIVFQEKLVNVIKELEQSVDYSEDLAVFVNVLVFELKDANSQREKLESRLMEAEHEILKAEDLAKNFEHEVYIWQTEFENVCLKAECIEKELLTIKSNFKDKMNENYLESCEISKQLNGSLDYVHDIKLKLTELNSAMISGNKCEKKFRTKTMLAEVDVLPSDESWKECSGMQSPVPPSIGLGQEIGNLRKELEDKTDLISNLQKTTNEMKIVIDENKDLVKKLSDDNMTLVNDLALIKNNLNEKMSLVINLSDELCQLKKQYTELEKHQQANEEQMVNDLKEKMFLISNLSDELNQVKKQYTELEKHNQVTKEQFHLNLDIDSELRHGKKSIVQEINLLEPGKIIGPLNSHNLTDLLDTFVNLIMAKEQQIVADLVNEQSKTKQQYEEKIKQYLEDIKKGKEWLEQVESDNDKLSLELENLKSQKDIFPSKEIEIKVLTDKVLEVEAQSYDYLIELQELKTKISKTNDQNFHALSLEFELFKANSEQSIQNLQKEIEDLTDKYNKSVSMYKDQESSHFALENQLVKFQTECDCLKSILGKKDEDIKNLIDEIKLKKEEYQTLLAKNGLQKEEMREIIESKVNDLQFKLSDETQKLNYTEKMLKEATKNYSQLVEKNSSNLLEIEQLKNSCDSLEIKIKDMKEEIEDLKFTNVNLDSENESMLVRLQTCEDDYAQLVSQISELRLDIKILTEERDFLKNKCDQSKQVNDDIKKLNDEICDYEQNIYQLRKEKGQLIVQHEKELKQIKSELNEVNANNLKLSYEYNKLAETAKNLEKSLKEDIQELNRCITDKNAKISTMEFISKTNTDDYKKKIQELQYVFKKAREENHKLHKEYRRLKEQTDVIKTDQSTQTVEEQSVVSGVIMAEHKSTAERITKLENDNSLMKTMLHRRKVKIEELQKQLAEKH